MSRLRISLRPRLEIIPFIEKQFSMNGKKYTLISFLIFEILIAKPNEQ